MILSAVFWPGAVLIARWVNLGLDLTKVGAGLEKAHLDQYRTPACCRQQFRLDATPSTCAHDRGVAIEHRCSHCLLATKNLPAAGQTSEDRVGD